MTTRNVPPDFAEQVEQLRLKALQRIDSIPVAALIWGPTPTATCPVSAARVRLRDELSRRGHLASFSEDLLDPSSKRSILTQQIAHAEAHDIVFSLPGSPGSIAEIHDFARVPWLSHKIVAFLDRQWSAGYSNLSLIQLQSNATCQIQLYDCAELPDCITTMALDLVGRLQEVYYMNGRRF